MQLRRPGNQFSCLTKGRSGVRTARFFRMRSTAGITQVREFAARRALCLCFAAGLLFASNARALDLNGNQMSDVWEMIFNVAPTLPANADADGDGFSNLDEARAATDPFNAQSRPAVTLAFAGTNSLLTSWSSAP